MLLLSEGYKQKVLSGLVYNLVKVGKRLRLYTKNNKNTVEYIIEGGYGNGHYICKKFKDHNEVRDWIVQTYNTLILRGE